MHGPRQMAGMSEQNVFQTHDSLSRMEKKTFPLTSFESPKAPFPHPGQCAWASTVAESLAAGGGVRSWRQYKAPGQADLPTVPSGSSGPALQLFLTSS